MTGLTFIKMSLKALMKYVRRFSIPFVLSDLLALKKRKSRPGELDDEAMSKALERLRDVLNRGDLMNKHRIPNAAPDDKNSVDIFITFDEAHALSWRDDSTNESRFIALRRVLNELKSEPVFYFFLSTTGKITQFGPSSSRDPSDRVSDGSLVTPRPYIYLGFDQLMKNRKLFAPVASDSPDSPTSPVPPAPSKNTLTLHDITLMEFAAHLGRPLWVISCSIAGIFSYFLDGAHVMTKARSKSKTR
jgi:hypothetical protein